MVSVWNPDIKKSRIRGVSVRTLSLCAIWASATFLALLPVFFIGLMVRESGDLDAIFPISTLALLGAAGLAATVCHVAGSYWVAPAEIRAGYTTTRGNYKYLAEVDPRTNRIVRMPGEDFLGGDEYRRRISMIRELDIQSRRNSNVEATADSAIADELEIDLAPVIKDGFGVPLADGDSVIVLKELRSKTSPLVIKAGTKVEGIRLVFDRTDDKVVSIELPGNRRFALRSNSVKRV